MRGNPVSRKAAQAAQSYVSWLADAGADVATQDQPASWLDTGDRAGDSAETPAKAKEAARADPAATPPPRKAQVPSEAQPADLLPSDQWPTSVPALHEMLGSGAALPGNQYGGRPILPKGNAPAKYMLLLDLPEREDLDAGELASGQQGVLLKNMMAAIGVDLAQCYCAPLAFTRPATGMLPEQDLPILAEFARHQIGLVQPKTVLIFGSSASTALFGAELMNARGNLHYFNHNDQNVAALTTFHPRTLLARPQMKAQAWKDLQVILK